ncbi:MAG TPA: type I glyceraldehyde-3-phosphate dehydrogenase [Acidobacteriota bacterium]|jgi:glyceraldehyde 3-phosphate dehydrogenase|nr:type I glyceraldehyde-3-phosphate dehydrogenase [Acidobacteriota bacterium]HNT18130.1 type I glyceraldehyde-3-phosphate dehydrogenase [Acidobacteriota bacterium]HPA27103.1 type I glyceraldehyde-3-phosphate dehydrogenase [Acidobacteriota bacterium]HQO20759.1 type I glyceraldehyde-3-phosphate dehydrogenase [Acidobacteriota bacterium]HQQ47567.1 type I glyceraldehyde-3-phosphate dehydrogenase [Acidobacteriota bacterium]
MALKVAINGFGRIGRHIFRQMIKDNSFEVVAVNDITDAPTLAHLLKYDSAYGIFDMPVQVAENSLEVGGKSVQVLAKSSIEGSLWKDLGIDLVIESTGKYAKGDKIRVHQEAGAKYTLISAPAKGCDLMVVYGVNHKKLDKNKHKIISNASCTTNCLAPIVKVIHEKFGIVHGLLTTIHAVTNDQRLLDLPHSDLRRARASLVSMIPTTTGAAKAIGEVMPELKGKLDGTSVRVPTITVSLVDLTFTTEKSISVDSINAALTEAKEGELKGVLDVTELPLVSVDFTGNSHSSIVDGLSTMVMGDKFGKVLSWYDNEWGYASRCIDVAKLFA